MTSLFGFGFPNGASAPLPPTASRQEGSETPGRAAEQGLQAVLPSPKPTPAIAATTMPNASLALDDPTPPAAFGGLSRSQSGGSRSGREKKKKEEQEKGEDKGTGIGSLSQSGPAASQNSRSRSGPSPGPDAPAAGGAALHSHGSDSSAKAKLLPLSLDEDPALSRHFLTNYLAGKPPEVPSYSLEHFEGIDDAAGAMVLTHRSTGVRVWTEALDLRCLMPLSKDWDVLYHYTSLMGFTVITQHGLTDTEIIASFRTPEAAPGRERTGSPEVLLVTFPESKQHYEEHLLCKGKYLLQKDELNGMPVWVHERLDRQLFFDTADHHWYCSNVEVTTAHNEGVQYCYRYFRHSDRNMSLPHDLVGDWEMDAAPRTAGRWHLDPQWSKASGLKVKTTLGIPGTPVGEDWAAASLGIWFCHKDPAHFESINKVLQNLFLPLSMPIGRSGDRFLRAGCVARNEGKVDFCIPVLVPRNLCRDVRLPDRNGVVLAADDRDLRLLSLTDLHIDRMLSDRGSSRIRILAQRLAFTQATHGVIHEASMDVLTKLLQSLKVNGRSHEIEKHLRAAIKLVEANYGLEGPVAWKAVDRLAALIAKVRNVDGLGLEPHLRSAAVGPTQPSSRDSLSNFALLLEAKGPAMTEKTMRDNLVGKQETLGLAHPSTLTLLCNLARVLQVRGQVEEAERLLRAGVTESEMLLGAHSLCTLTFLNNLALVLQQPIGSPEAAIEETRREEATTTLRRAVEGFTAVLERGHRSTLLVAENYAEALEAVGNDSEATEAFEETYFIARGSLGRLHPDTLRYLDRLCRRHEAFGRSEEALKLRRSAWEEADRASRQPRPSEQPPPGLSMTLALQRQLAAALVHIFALKEDASLESPKTLAATIPPTRQRPERPQHENHEQGMPLQGSTQQQQQQQHQQQQQQPVQQQVQKPEQQWHFAAATAEAEAVSPEMQEAEALLTSGLDRGSAALGAGHNAVRAIVEDLAMLRLRQHRNEEAEKLLRSIIETDELESRIKTPVGQVKKLITLSKLARVQEALGDLRSAERTSRQVVSETLQYRGPEHLETVGAVQNLALLLQSMTGHQEEAEQLLREVLAAREDLEGASAPSTLTTASYLATFLKRTGRFKEAEKLLKRILETREGTLGPDHPSTLAALNNLAMLLEIRGKKEAAESLMRRALQVSESLYGARSQSALSFLGNLGMLLQGMGRAEEALDCLKRAWEDSKESLGPKHPNTLTFSNNLAMLLESMGRLEEALELISETVAGRKVGLGPTHPSTLTSMVNMASLLEEMGREEDAERLYRETYELSEVSWGQTHASTLAALNNLGMCLTKREESLEEAETLLTKALDGYARTLGPSHPDTKTAMQNLKECLEARGKSQEAKRINLIIQREEARCKAEVSAEGEVKEGGCATM